MFNLGNMSGQQLLVNGIEILVILITFFLFYKKFIKNTGSEKFVRGVFVLLVLWVISQIFMTIHLNILGLFLRYVVMFITLSLIVVFQPELRKFLGMLGQASFFRRLLFKKNNPKNTNHNVNEIVKAAEYMSKTHTGALIVFKNDFTDSVSNMGTILNADISSELLLTLFFPKTPLHDGAIIIKDNKIVSAGAILPLTEKKGLEWRYGTRHRAALGMSEVSDAHVLIVSEETGDISIAKNGTLKKYKNMKTLETDLSEILKK